MNELVSIIVPVYNAEKYLNRCVESLIKQTHVNVEIMLIDDGSKDRSLELCKAWQKRDSRVVVYHHDNHGVSYTRNVGLSCFKGDYVTFVDADDWVELSYVEYLLRLIKTNNVPIASCGYMLDREDGTSENWRDFEARVLPFTEVLDPYVPEFLGGVSSKMYAWEIIKNQENDVLKFDEDIKIAEDRLFWYKAVLKGEKVAVSSEPLYHYCMNGAGATLSKDFRGAYSDFVARNRIAELVKSNLHLYKKCVSSCVYMAWQALFLASKTDDAQKEIKRYVRDNGRMYLSAPYIGRKDKLKMLAVCFPLTRRILLWYLNRMNNK